MKIKLPKVLENYIRASNHSDLNDFISCFSDSAVVQDEGQIRRGYEEIGNWFKKTRAKYKFRAVPINISRQSDDIILSCEVSGNFPGSPVTLDYHFKIRSDLIHELSIK